MRELSKAQRDALLFGAMTGPMAINAGGKSLLWALPALVIAAGLYFAVRKVLPEGHGLAEYLPVWILVPEFLFLILAAAKTSAYITDCWPEQGTWPLFPLILLALSGAATWEGTDAVGRCALLLGLTCALFYSIVLSAAVMEPGIILEENHWTDGFPVLLTALSAICGLFLPSKKGGGRLWLGILGFVVLLLICTGGREGRLPILTSIKGIQLFGILQRFEALGSCVITIGLFLILTVIAGAGSEIVSAMGIGQLKGFAVIIPAAAVVWWADEIHPALLALACGVFWGVIPLLTLPVVVKASGQKKWEKREKRS